MQIRILRCFLLRSLLVLASSSCLFSQNQPPVSDPQALSLVSQSITALTGGTRIYDVTLNGTATCSNGSGSETANATLMAKGTGESRFDMTLSAGPRSEIRNDGSSNTLGELLVPDGSILPWGLQNCMVNAVWFFPHLSVLGVTGDSTLIFSYIGQESRNGIAVQHIQSYRYSRADATTTRQLSTMDIYLDAASFLPTAFIFNIHPENAVAQQSIPVEVDFSNYQSLNGVLVPFRIRRYVTGGLGFDFTVGTAQFNAGLPDSLFDIQ